MTFEQLNLKIDEQFQKMQKDGTPLFRLNITGDQIWEAYLTGFTADENPVFRDPSSSQHNCNNDKHFIRRYGNVVSLDSNLNIMTMFDIEVEYPYQNAITAVKNLLKTGKIEDVFVITFDELNTLPYEKTNVTNKASKKTYQLGMSRTLKTYSEAEAVLYGGVTPGIIYTFDHFHVQLKSDYVWFDSRSIDSIRGDLRANFDVFERTMRTLPLDTLELVQDLITQNSVINSAQHLEKIKSVATLKAAYDALGDSLLPSEKRHNFCWLKSYKYPYSRFRNESIGTLCVQLAEGEEINSACRAYNRMVDPQNYQKAVAPITPAQVEAAEKFVSENGYVESFNRRMATAEDINISEILHFNADGKVEKPAGLFSDVKATTVNRHKRNRFEGVSEISIDKFMSDILPGATSLEMFVENRLKDNFVALHTSVNPESKPMFNWSNNFGFTYINNLAGKSTIKQAVKDAGGNVSGVLRFSIVWNNPADDTEGTVDFDLSAVEPTGSRIDFRSPYRQDRGGKTKSGGMLDVDMIRPSKVGVENIFWGNAAQLQPGRYTSFVTNYDGGSNKGLIFQVEMNGEIYTYRMHRWTHSSAVPAITVEYTPRGEFKILGVGPMLVEMDRVVNTVWGINTEEFHKVSLCCLSPNYWKDNNAGNKHYLFMLDGCRPEGKLRTFHNEFLNSELRNHRKVIDVLGNSRMVEATGKCLAGIGFNATLSDEVIIKVKGTHERVFKVKI